MVVSNLKFVASVFWKSTFGKVIVAGISVAALIVLAIFVFHTAGIAPPPGIVTGNVRVQLLSDSLVRIELKGPVGFEDRETFHVVNRDWPGAAFALKTNSAVVEIRTANYVVAIPQNAMTLDGVRIVSVGGQVLYHCDGKLDNNKWLPGPAGKPEVWSFADTPRINPPPWGLTPAPVLAKRWGTSGWDLDNDAPDIYVFLPSGDYRQLRKDFLKLTGPTEIPPMFAFGAFDSRWYDYSEATALKQIDDYRAHKIPLDVLVVDTGWRQNASTGYQPNTDLFPDMKRFFQEAHAKHVRIMFNDHPEPKVDSGLAQTELQYRYDGLSGLLKEGLDFWWYDRNWEVHLVPPKPNLNKEVWGMRLYHDITQRIRQDSRPLIMANVDGIDNGIRDRPMDVASHRFPIQWTGDIGPGFDFLRYAVENAVYSGVQSLFPYESDDLGGHVANPTPEQYIRWIEYGALSPVYRPHCTHNLERMPWVFGPEAEQVARRFVDMRYRLLPVFYAAAHENYDTGEPLLRRLDLDYPQFAGASRDDEYLIGENILVAPVLESSSRMVPNEWLKAPDGQPGLKVDFFPNEDLAGPPTLTRTDNVVDFKWEEKGPAPNFPRTHYSVRWTGIIEVPAAIGDVVLTTLADDGARVWVDGNKVIDAWGFHNAATTEASAVLTAGHPHELRVEFEYMQLNYDAIKKLLWHSAKARSTIRVAWIPPGDWINAWTGETIAGPTMRTNDVPMGQIPIYIKSGAVLPLAPEMQYTGQLPWNPITLDLYPRVAETNSATLYEDDTLTTAYQRGEFHNTQITASMNSTDRTVYVNIAAAKGMFRGALNERAWILRIHLPTDWLKNLATAQVLANGEKINVQTRQLNRAATAMPFGDRAGAPDSDVFEVTLPAAPLSQNQSLEIRLSPVKVIP